MMNALNVRSLERNTTRNIKKVIYECKGQYLKTCEYGHLKETCLLINIEDVLKEFIRFMDAYGCINQKQAIDMNYLIQKFME